MFLASLCAQVLRQAHPVSRPLRPLLPRFPPLPRRRFLISSQTPFAGSGLGRKMFKKTMLKA